MKPTLTWAKRTLKAVDELIGQYKDGTHNTRPGDCPFCIQVDRFGKDNSWGDDDKCVDCPWMVFGKRHCCAGGQYYPPSSEAPYHQIPIPLRLRRLYGWRKRLENMIKKFEETSNG